MTTNRKTGRKTGSKTGSKTIQTLVLPARMEIGGLEQLYTEMTKFTSRKRKELTIDGGEVSVIDTAGIQVLVAFIRKLTAMGCAVSWENYSVQVYQMAEELGVGSQLGE